MVDRSPTVPATSGARGVARSRGRASQPERRHPYLYLPAHARQFVADAEAAFNGKDIAAVCGVYAPSASVSFFTDGTYDRVTGPAEIHLAWEAIFAALPAFTVRKHVLVAGRSGIVNDWIGSTSGGDHPHACGIEFWRFDDETAVVEHRLYSFLHLHLADSLIGTALFGLEHPLVAVRLQLARRKRSSPNGSATANATREGDAR